MSFLLTLDVGTTSVKTCVFNREFTLLGFSSEEYQLQTIGNNIVELHSDIYWEAVKSGIGRAVRLAGIKSSEISVITITTQGETLIPVDAYGKALRNAIVWLDARAEEEAAYIGRRFEAHEVYSVTGLPEINAACPVSKLLWIKNREPEVYHRTHKFLLLEDFLISKLTGKYVTEKSLMSSTGYFDINRGELWQDMLDHIGIDSGKFPAILDCGKNAGGILLDIADDIGLSPSAIVATGAMDQAASAIGSGNIVSGIVTETTGTAMVIAATTDLPDYSNPAKVTIYRHAVPGKFIILPYCQTAGIVLKWFKDEFCRYESEVCCETGKSIYAYMDELAEGIPPLSNGLILLPYFAGMMTPEINPGAKGVFFGMGLDTKKPHFIRAILESIAYMLRDQIELLEGMGVTVGEIRSLGGGSKSPLWSGIKADVNNKVIVTMDQEESTSLGAAILGSMTAGMYGSIEEACRAIKPKERYIPEAARTALYSEGYQTYNKVYDSVKKMF